MRNSFYLPVIGGRKRNEVDILSVSKSGLGTVEQVGDLVRFDAGPNLMNMPLGKSDRFSVSLTYTVDGGNAIVGTIVLTATKTADGVDLILPNGRVAKDGAYLSPVLVANQLEDPFVFPDISLPAFTISDQIILDIFNTRNPEFLAAVNAAQGRVNAADANVDDAQDKLRAVENAAFLLGEALLARETATALRKIADGAEVVFTEAVNGINAATDALTDAVFDFGIAQAAVDTAQTAAAIASGAVASLNAALAPLVGQAAGFLDDLFGILSTFGISQTRTFIENNLDTPIIGGLLRPIYDLLVTVEDSIDDLRADLRRAEDDFDDALEDVSDALSDFNQANIDLQAAEDALDDALALDVDALEFAFSQADQLATQAENAAASLERQVSNLGFEVPVKLGVLDDVALEAAEALVELGLAEGALLLAQGELLVANSAYQAATAFLPDFDFKFALSEFSLGLDLQAGLEFNWNRRTEDEPGDSVTSILYEVGVDFDFEAFIEVDGERRSFDVDRDEDIAGRIPLKELGDRDRGDLKFGERLSSWADTFDFA